MEESLTILCGSSLPLANSERCLDFARHDKVSVVANLAGKRVPAERKGAVLRGNLDTEAGGEALRRDLPGLGGD